MAEGITLALRQLVLANFANCEMPFKNSWHFSDAPTTAHFSFRRLTMFFSTGCPFAAQRQEEFNATSHARGLLVFHYQIEKHQGPVVNFEVFPANLRA